MQGGRVEWRGASRVVEAAHTPVFLCRARTSGARYDRLWMYEVGTSVIKHDDPKSIT